MWDFCLSRYFSLILSTSVAIGMKDYLKFISIKEGLYLTIKNELKPRLQLTLPLTKPVKTVVSPVFLFSA